MSYTTVTNGLMPRVTVSHTIQRPEQIIECEMGHCGAAIPEGITVRLCMNHLRKAHAAYLIATAEGDDYQGREIQPRNVWANSTKGYVYFARVGEMIKVGWTHDMHKRMNGLRPDAVMHYQPGTRDDERAFHKIFGKHLVKGREWFRAEPELFEFIERLRTKAA